MLSLLLGVELLYETVVKEDTINVLSIYMFVNPPSLTMFFNILRMGEAMSGTPCSLGHLLTQYRIPFAVLGAHYLSRKPNSLLDGA